jgi:heme exporter protein CcmD
MASHTEFIVAAFGLSAAVVAGMIFVLMADYRALRRDLARFPDRAGEGEG